MGLTAAYALVPAVESPLGDAVGVRCEGAASGWAAYALDGDGPFDLAPRLAAHSGPLVTAVVHDSDFCVVAGRVAGEEIFRWIVNEELSAAYGLGGRHEEPDESTHAVERAAAVEAIRDWAHRSGLPDIDAERVNDVLARGYVLAEEGLWALLAELGALPPGGHLPPTTPPDPSSEWATERPPPQPVAVVLSDGDASALPTHPRRIMLAAALAHDSSAWDRFVRRHELEEWGRPACLIADSGDVIPQGGLQTWARWHIALGSDPAIGLFTWSGALGAWFEGPWVMIPDETTADETTAIVWARENVGHRGSPPTAHRQQLATECDPDDRRYGSDHIRARVADARLGFALFTYRDLMDDTRACSTGSPTSTTPSSHRSPHSSTTSWSTTSPRKSPTAPNSA
jgi:hypothetical protein